MENIHLVCRSNASEIFHENLTNQEEPLGQQLDMNWLTGDTAEKEVLGGAAEKTCYASDVRESARYQIARTSTHNALGPGVGGHGVPPAEHNCTAEHACKTTPSILY